MSRDDDVRLQLARAFDRAPASWVVSLHETPPDDADVTVAGPDVAIAGSIVFDPAHPERLVPDIQNVATRSSEGKRIFVMGATGGSGATSLALHLAAAAGGCLVETRPGDIRRRLDMGSARSWSGDQQASIELDALPVAPGFRALLAPRAPSTEDVATAVARASSAFSVLFVDSGPDVAMRLATPGDLCVLVLCPTRPAAERAREILDGGDAFRWAVVTNRVGPGSVLTRRRLEQILDRRISIELPCSPGLRDAEDEGRLLTSPLSRWSWNVKRLCRALETA